MSFIIQVFSTFRAEIIISKTFKETKTTPGHRETGKKSNHTYTNHVEADRPFSHSRRECVVLQAGDARRFVVEGIR